MKEIKQTLINRLVIEKCDQFFEFHMPVNSELGAAYDAAFDVFMILGKNIEERNKKIEEDAKKDKEEAE